MATVGRAARRRRLVQPLAARRRHRSPSSQRAGADPDRLLVVEVSERFPRTLGLPPEHRHALHVDEIDVLVESEAEPVRRSPEPDADRRRPGDRRRTPRAFIPDGATLQTGIGAVPSTIAGAARRGRRRRLRRPLGDVHRPG